jgi:hypothetical protein
MAGYFGTGSATADLGFGGSNLASQVAGETEEERKRRLAQLQQSRLAGPYGQPATMALFGSGLGPRLGGARMGIGQI